MSHSSSSNKYRIKLLDRYPVADRTLAFKLEKPPGFSFRPGQYIDLTLIDPKETDKKGNVRGFSIASAPDDDFLLVATRIRDTAFKRQIAELPIGSEIEMEGPGGGFGLHNNVSRAAIFLIGGIGVTPIRSILARAAAENLPHPILVLYSNHQKKDAAFLDDLNGFQRKNPNIKLVSTMTAVEASDQSWRGERGRISEELLNKYRGGWNTPIYYIVGPPKMVQGIHEMLNKAGIDDDDIRLEDFGGY